MPAAYAGAHLTAREHARVTGLRADVGRARTATWGWQTTMGERRTRTVFSERRTTSIRYLGWVSRLWRGRMVAARTRAENPPHLTAWLCIHRGEGSWTDGGAPFYGGLQMDLQFQRTYGPDLLRAKGTADHWTPLEQMWVAERAYPTRGFYPWPQTARACGLI